MKYRFPEINSIDDVRPHIENRSDIIIANRGNYDWIDYLINIPDTFTKTDENDSWLYRRECRGLVFDKNGKIIRRPLHKFFNVNERPETQVHALPDDPYIIMEKLDGSMIAPMIVDGEIIWATRRVSPHLHNLVEEYVKDNPIYYDIVRSFNEYGATPIFEFVSPKQRIVVKYKNSQLSILAARDIITGVYWSLDQIQSISCDVPLVTTYGIQTGGIKELVDQTYKDVSEREGVVLRYLDGHMIKVKTTKYCDIHHAKSIINEKTIIKSIVNNNIDDLISLLDRDEQVEIEKFALKFFDGINKTVERLHNEAKVLLEKYPERKDYAASEENSQSELLRGIMFDIIYNDVSKESLREKIIEKIKFFLGSNPRIEKVRYLFGGIRFEQIFMVSDG